MSVRSLSALLDRPLGRGLGQPRRSRDLAAAITASALRALRPLSRSHDVLADLYFDRPRNALMRQEEPDGRLRDVPASISTSPRAAPIATSQVPSHSTGLISYGERHDSETHRRLPSLQALVRHRPFGVVRLRPENAVPRLPVLRPLFV